MKHSTMNTMIAAAVAVLAAGGASAQSLKADIPFTFHVATSVMAPGTYQLMHASNRGSKYLILRNADTGKSVIAIYELADAANELKAQGTPGIQFECGGRECALRQIWTASENTAYGFQGPKLGSDGNRRMAVIPLTVIKAD
jgi:hypothetical protein